MKFFFSIYYVNMIIFEKEENTFFECINEEQNDRGCLKGYMRVIRGIVKKIGSAFYSVIITLLITKNYYRSKSFVVAITVVYLRNACNVSCTIVV